MWSLGAPASFRCTSATVALLLLLMVGLVEPCALPYWWIQQYSLPPSYLQSAAQPKITYSYRETFQAFDPHSFVHTKEYTEYTWWENGISAGNAPVQPPDLKPVTGNEAPEVVNRKTIVSTKGSRTTKNPATVSSPPPPPPSLPPPADATANPEAERNENESDNLTIDDLSRSGKAMEPLLEEETALRTNSVQQDPEEKPRPCTALDADIHSLRSMIEKMFNYPREHTKHLENKEKARQEILNKFKDFGLQVWTQNFTVPYSAAMEGKDDEQQEVREGVNLVGVIPGAQRGQLEDGIVLVGAHYDTVPDSNGVDDNGSGLAVMLEVAKTLTQSRCRFNNTLMFVAFDLQENGAMGSNFFVDNYLIPEELKRARAHFQGAFILDGILNFNDNPNTQELPIDYAQSLPGLQYFVNNTGNRGDFLAMISRNRVDAHLAKSLMDAWQKLGDHNYKLYNLAINMGNIIPSPLAIESHLNFLNSDHATFWYHNSSSHFPETLNAVLLTDTGPFRGQMKKCYHSECDDLTAMSPEKLQFARKTANALSATLVEMTRATAKANDIRGSTTRVFLLAFLLMLLLTRSEL